MNEPKKVNLESKNITEETLEELKRLVPSAFKEGKIDFDALKSVLGEVVEPSREFYNFTWAGKSEAFRTLQRPSTATLRPCIEESKEWDKTENLFIEGDNLEVLKLLQKTYHNSIKMIYIDPPYNKDKDFVYPDRWSEGIKSYKEFCGFVDSEGNITTSEDEAKNATGRKHSRWLTMMYPRLFLARNLLKDDGVIFVSIDDDEAANLKKMMDEIFGEENFVAHLTIQGFANESNEGVLFQNVTEYCVCYAKDKTQAKINKIDAVSQDLRSLNDAPSALSSRKTMGYTIYYNQATEDIVPKIDYDINGDFSNIDDIYTDDIELITKGYVPIRPLPRNGVAWRWRWGLETLLERKQELKFRQNRNGTWIVEFGQSGFNAPRDYQEFGTGTSEVKNLFGNQEVFTKPKSTEFLQWIQQVATSQCDTVLDFFSGSGTTAHAVMALNAEDGGNRKYICVQIPEPTPEKSEARKAGYKTIAEICKERIRRAGEKVKADNKDKDLSKLDIGFKVFKLDESNFKQWDMEVADAQTLKQQIIDFADNVSPEASKRDMLYELLLKKGFNLNAKVEKKQIADNEIFVVDDSSRGVGSPHEADTSGSADSIKGIMICLDDKISTTTIDEVIKLRPAHFIVLDRAFEGNDQLKTNTWQTFKSLFPNDENPFETV